MERLDEYLMLRENIKNDHGNVKLGYVVADFGKMDSLVRPDNYNGTLAYGVNNTPDNKKIVVDKHLIAIEKALFKLGETKKNAAYVLMDLINTGKDLPKKSKKEFWLELAGQKMDVHTLKPELVKKLCNDAPFGDLASNTTKIDHAVRRAWTCPGARFKIGDKDVCDTHVRKEMEDFFGGEVDVLPHSFNMYEEEGHFKSHVDTQRHDRMIGTLVVVFSTKMVGGELFVDGEELYVDNSEKSGELFVSAVMFRATTPHCVKPVKDGFRYSVSYDICMSRKRSHTTKDTFALFHSIDKQMIAGKIDTIGIILRNRYSPKLIDEKCFLGDFDNVVGEGFTDLFARRFISVLWHVELQHAFSDYSSDETKKNVVYTLDEKEHTTNIPFFCEFAQWSKLSSEEERGSSYTGNESQDGKSDRIYASYAVLLTRNSVLSSNKKK